MALVSANSRLRGSVEGISSATTTTNSNSFFSEDLLIEILSRLPVKALVRFKSACRRWYDLISNPNFISAHLKNNSTNKVCCDDDDDNFCGLKLVSSYGVNDRDPESIYDHLRMNLKVDFDMKETRLDVVGYCDGIFCLSSRPVTRTTIVLHNPALRETRVLPPTPSAYPANQRNCSYNVGFGFDQKTKDYIVVKMATFKKRGAVSSVNETESAVVEVYYLSTDSWRVFDNAVKDLDTNASSAMVIRDFANGIPCLYFNPPFRKEEVVFPFHIDDEMFSMHLRLPTSHYTFNRKVPLTFLHLSMLNHKLTFIRSYIVVEVVDGHTLVEIWVMTNSCDVEKPTWSLVFTVESFPDPCRVLGFWNTNILMMYNYISRCTFLYDLVTKQYMDPQLCGELDFFYKESLVSVERTTTL